MTSTNLTSLLDSNSSTIQPNLTTMAAIEIYWETKDTIQFIIEVIFLTILTAFGTIGNLTVIFSIMLERRVHSHGNMFVISLAFADLLITGFVAPTVIANVVGGKNALPYEACQAAGYVVTVTCTCSLCNLTFIAINRYWAVVYSKTYITYFTKFNVYMMVLGTWVWSNLLSLPTMVGWSRVAYDVKMQLCSWDDTYSRSYTIFLSLLAVIIPLCIIFFCYTKLFMAVRNSGRWVRSLSTVSGVNQNSEQHRRSMRKERNLLKTLATTVAFFVVCWFPYAVTIIVDPNGIPATPKKIFGWMGLSNSAVNFVIYGVMNPVFRRGYRNLFYLVCKCKRARRFGSGFQGSHSDSFYRSTRRKSGPITPPSKSSIKIKSNAIINQRSASLSIQHSTPAKESIGWRTPQLEAKNIPKSETNGKPPMNSFSAIFSEQDKLDRVDNSVNIVKKSSAVLKRKKTNEKEKKLLDREARLKRNSLMLLQIEMNDDDDNDEDGFMKYRRTQSEIPSGVKKPGKLRRNSNNIIKSEYSYSQVSQDNNSLNGGIMGNNTTKNAKNNSECDAGQNNSESNSDCENINSNRSPSSSSSSDKLSNTHESTEMIETLSVEPNQRSAQLLHSTSTNTTPEEEVK